ncbi:hypothetical protein ACLKA7_011603 [Drosophila subpalustris]
MNCGDAVTKSPSAFERFKALRRYNRCNGHKSHKKRYKNYLKHDSTLSKKYALKLRKDREHREREWDQDQVHEQKYSQAAPIFALGVRPQRVTPKPFYEGKVNYYDHQENQQQHQSDSHHSEMDRLIATDNGIWYRRISPVFRNGVKTNEQQLHHQAKHQHQHHHHKHLHLRQRQPNPYQRQTVSQLSAPAPESTPTAPLQPPKQQLGHQITDSEQLERYYAKWPHLARVQFQVYDEHFRGSHSELYSDYDTEEDYETAAELEEAQHDHGEEANLPPYIKKYNRRNKQLLNLLEGPLSPPTTTTIPTHTPTQTQSVDVWSSLQLQPRHHKSAPIRLDDEYMKQKRQRYQQRYEDLFAPQRSRSNSSSSSGSSGNDSITMPANLLSSLESLSLLNQLPEDDKQVEQLEDADSYWQSEIKAEANSALLPSTTGRSTPKPALFKLPLNPAIASSFLGTPRSRSAQFLANVAGRSQSSWNSAFQNYATGYAKDDGDGDGNSTTVPSPSSPLNLFVYHRVLDGSRKQRLPFVAMTDRRLESKDYYVHRACQHQPKCRSREVFGGRQAEREIEA